MSELTVSEVAAWVPVIPMTVRRRLHAGSLTGPCCDGCEACRVRENDLADFLDARRRGGVQEWPLRSVPLPEHC